MIDALDIGYAIKDRRAQLGLTQAQVADASGVSKRCLWSLELGRNPGVQFNKLAAVFEVLGLSLSIGAGDIPESTLRENAVKLAAHKTNPPKEPLSNIEADGTLDAFAILTGATK